RALVKATGTANPKKDFGRFASGSQLGHGGNIQTHEGSLKTSIVAGRLTSGLNVPV
ncbi:MAG: hypothetical protein RLZZ261_1072, partial [Bacteroidota bacterium]